jgi:hypothetical protein
MTCPRARGVLSAVLTVLVVLFGTTRASADPVPGLAGEWRLAEGLLDGHRVRGRLSVVPVAPGEWDIEAHYRSRAGLATSSWFGVLRAEGEGLRVTMNRSRGLVGSLLGRSTPASGEGRYVLDAGALVGTWRLGDQFGRDVFVRDDETLPALRAAVLNEPVEGAFGQGEEAWPQLNANDPEILTSVAGGRVLVASTLSPQGRADPAVHLDRAFDQPFRIFASNQNRTGRTIWQVVALANPGQVPVRVAVEALASAATPEAPYRDLGLTAPHESVREVFDSASGASGPGDRASGAALLGESDGPGSVVVPAGGVALLSVRRVPHRAERMLHAHLRPDGAVRAAVLYLPRGRPTLDRVTTALASGRRVPRSQHDHEPSLPGATSGALIFGRVSGVVAASAWQGVLTNDAERRVYLTVPGDERSFLWNGKHGDVGQAQSGEVVARVPSSAYRSWGNYGGSFEIGAALRNPTDQAVVVSFLVDSPGRGRARALRQLFELVVRGPAGEGRRLARVSQRMGTRGSKPLFEVEVPPGSLRRVQLRAVYAANNTAPNPLRLAVRPAGVRTAGPPAPR